MSDQAPRIAIVGMAGQFPGARDTAQLWANLLAGRESITRLGADEMRPNEPELDDLLGRDNFVNARGILEGVELFDAEFFGFSPREAELLDPQHRLWLEACWTALEQAGIDPYRFDGPIGLYAGTGYMEQYLLNNLLRDRATAHNLAKLRAVDSFATKIFNDSDYLPTRVAHKFDLRGPAVNVQTACSTSLVALHMACQSLLAFETDLALAGAVAIDTPQHRGYLAQEGGMFSQDGHCRPFDADAAGTVFASGLGVFVLKRYDEAVDDQDDIWAVIRGSAINNDGAHKVSYVAPSPDGQAEVIAMAQAVADVHPDDVGYIEAHGTATPLGDPIEIDGLTKAWRRKSTATAQVGIGSIKSNIGHLDAAAGAAGLVKLAYALREGKLPPSLHYKAPNPRIDFAASPFAVVNTLRDWPGADKPRIAGISSFGVGGTNAHLVVEQPPQRPAAAPVNRAPQLLVLSAKTPEALAKRCRDLADWLESNPAAVLADVAWTLATGRAELACRQSLVVADTGEAVAALRKAAEEAARVAPTTADQPPVAFLFPGQGAQHPGMARALYNSEPLFRDTIDRLAGYLQPQLGVDLRLVLFPATDNDDADAQLRDTGMAQPAIFAVSYALARLWQHWGVQPDGMLGHSVGEYVAACLTGVFSEQDCCTVLAQRAKLMADMPAGSMLAVRRSAENTEALVGDGVELAAINGPNLCIVSGPYAAIDALATRLEADGEPGIRLHTSHAFHSAMMEPALVPFQTAVEAVERKAPHSAFVSCLTGEPVTADEAANPEYWAKQLRHTVRFSPALGVLMQDPQRIYLECGPSQNLSTAVRQHKTAEQSPVCVPSQAHAAAETPADVALLQAAGNLWQRGVKLDWSALFGIDEGVVRRREQLPTYPFQHQRYWVEPPLRTAAETQVQAPATAVPVEPAAAPHENTQAAKPAQQPLTRKQQIQRALVALFLDISGTEIKPDAYAASFPEMGMDSLLLTQVAADLSSRFGIALRFRQLLEELSSIDTLVDYLDTELPADQFAEGAATEPTSAPAPAGITALPQAVQSDAGLQALVQQQIALTQQLAALTGLAVSDIGGGHQVAEPHGGPRLQAVVTDGSQGKALAQHMASGRFGPYRTINKTKDGGLTERQQTYLDDLVQRLVAKTAGSKTRADRARKYLADPRAIANFRLIWKEAVYQIVCARSDGSRIWDIDDNEYIDVTSCFGAGFFGHRPEFINQALRKQIDLGYEVGPQTPLAAQAAEKLCGLVKQERATFCNTGSEAVTGALRCARTVTNRSKVVYFTGDYHGIFDEVLGRANVVKGQLTTRPSAPGIIQASVDNAMILDYGSDASLQILREQGDQIAAVMVEPVQSLYPEVQPRDFLHKVQAITREIGAAFIVDEVITGFRVAPGGICEAWELDADICTYGKILGGEVPIGAIAGKAKWIDAIDGGAWNYGDDSLPEAAATFFAGTFVRHPFAMAAANAVLDRIIADNGAMQAAANARCAEFAADMNAFFEAEAVPLRIRHFSSWFRIDFPQDLPYVNLLWFHMLVEGIYVRESAQKFFFSVTHTDADVQRLKQVIRSGVQALKAVGFVTTVTGAPVPEGVEAAPTHVAADEVEVSRGLVGVAVGESFPLTEAQREVWLGQAISPDSAAAFNELFFAELKGKLDTGLLREAVNTVTQRHEALQLRFSDDGETQHRVAWQPVDLPERDFRGLPSVRDQAIAHVKSMGQQPFDLETGPLLRVELLRLADEQWFVAICVHHLVCDGWSSVILLEELGATYSALREAVAVTLPTAVPFSDYARMQVQRAAGADNERAYWQQVFASAPPPLDLPLDFERPAEKTFVGASYSYDLNDDTLAAVKRMATAHKLTPYVVMLAAYKLLLSQLTEQTDLVVGIPVAGQALDGMPQLFGHCVQNMPIRTRIDAGQSFAEYANRVQAAVRGASAHADYTYGSILRTVDVPRDLSRLPLIEVIFNVDPAREGVQFSGLECEIFEAPKSSINFDLFFNLTQGKTSLSLDCDYNAGLFEQASIAQWSASYEALLKQVTADPGIRVQALMQQDNAAEYDVLDAFNPAPLAFDAQTDVGAMFKACATRHPQRSAVFHAKGAVGYAQLDQQSDAVAAALAAAGVAPGDRVGVSMQRKPALLAAMLGVFKAGAAVVPLDPGYPAARLVFMAEDAGLTLSLVDDSADLPGRTIPVDQAMAHRGTPPQLGQGGEREAYVIYTSGSTGQPKGVSVLQRNLVALLSWGHSYFDADDFAGMLGSTMVSFDIAMFENFAPLTCGGAVVLVENVFALTQPETLPGKVTWVHTVPSPLAEVLRAVRLPDSVQLVSTAGEPLSAELVGRVFEKSRIARMYDLYGPTEATVYATAAQRTPGGEVTIGRPIAGWRCYILDERGRRLPPGSIGELAIGGVGVAAGYNQRPDKTAQQFVADPFVGGQARMYKTGDLARWRPDGQLEYRGRADNQVKVRGIRIELGEIETVLGEHAAVAQAVVRVLDGPDGDAQLVAYWQLDDTAAEAPTAAELRRFCHAKLPMHMVPQQLMRQQHWPKTPSGKLDRNALPNPFAPAGNRGAGAAHGPAHVQAVLAIWSELLGAPVDAELQDSFLDLGGHSILAVRGVQAVRKQHGVEIPVRAMMIESLAQLAARLAAPGQGAAGS